jgi:hypothetical protein
LENCILVLLRLPPVLLSLFLSALPPPPSPAMCPSPSCPTPPLFAPRAAPALPAPPRRAAAARTATRATELANTCSRLPCLLLDLKHIPKLPVHSLLHSHTHICTAFLLPERDAPLEQRRSSCTLSSAASATSHPQSNAPVAPPPPTDAHKPAQFHFPALDRSDHCAGELGALPLLGLTVVPTIHCLSAPAKHTISTTSSRGSFLATSPPLYCPPATGTPPSTHGAPPSAPVHRRYAASVPLFANTGHPRDRREPLNLFPTSPLPLVSPLAEIWSPPIGIPV